MRNFFFFFFLFVGLLAKSQPFFENSDAFFQSYVSNNKVDYKRLHSTPNDLNKLVKEIGKKDYTTLAEPIQKAYLINCYNLLVIYQIIQNWPMQSVMNIGGFFDGTKFSVGGKKMTLNDLENNLIRKKYNDPRVHFALVCGANGCPPIIDKAYKPITLNKQLDQQTSIALNNPNFIQVLDDDQLKISEIFNWYKNDFLKNGSVIDYINTYRNSPFPKNQKFKYYSYDWSINSANKHQDTNSNDSTDNSLNLQAFNAGSLLQKGLIDLTIFNSIYTENKNDWLGQTHTGYRTTFANSLIQITYGSSKSARVNLGLDISLKGSGTSRSNNKYNEILRAFEFQNNDSTRFGVAFIAPKIRLQPFKNVKDFTLQSSYNIVLSKYPEGFNSPDGLVEDNLFWIEWGRHTWWNQFFYSKLLFKDNFQIFTEVDLLFRFGYNSTQISHVDIPTSIFFSYFFRSKITAYIMAQHLTRQAFNPNGANKNDWVINANYSQLGGGLKYQLNSSCTAELLYTNFLRGKNTGLGETFNLGFKYIIK